MFEAARHAGRVAARGFVLVFLFVFAVLGTPRLAGAADAADLYADMSLEDLLQVEVTSVSKKAQRLVESASAVYVISAEDIRRSGHTKLPEVLRLVPGMNVARVQAGRWAVSARGGQDVFSNNLLVMVDGRSIYTPLFGGVYWEMHHVPLEDIEQIEVIRGPGATVWGANAVNGVVNIITKSSEDSEGSFLSVRSGNEEMGSVDFRHGLRVDEDLALRVSGSYFNHDHSVGANNHDKPDGLQMGHLEFRSDWKPTGRDSIFLNLGRFTGRVQTGVTEWDSTFSPSAGTVAQRTQKPFGGHANLRWTREFDAGGSIEVASYYDVFNQISGDFKFRQRTYESTFQHNVRIGELHDVVWGVGARRIDIRNENSVSIAVVNEDEKLANYNAFFQDEIAILPDRLHLTVGSKVSWNSHTNWELQPRAQVMWTPNDTNRIWASISRAVRTPGEHETNMRIISAVLPYVPTAALAGLGLPATYACQGAPLSGTNCPVRLVPNDDMEAVNLTSYELGYRFQPKKSLSFDVALFYMDFEDVPIEGASFLESAGNVGFRFVNEENQTNFGAEVAATWAVEPWWRLSGSWQGLQVQVGSHHSPAEGEQVVPHHQFQFHSRMDLPWDLEFDTSLYYTGRRQWAGSAFTDGAAINSHVRVDTRLGWKPLDNLELSLVVQDLFDRRDTEFNETLGALGLLEIERSIYGQVRLTF